MLSRLSLPSARQITTLLLVVLLVHGATIPAHGATVTECAASMSTFGVSLITAPSLSGFALASAYDHCYPLGDITDENSVSETQAWEQSLGMNDSQQTYITTANNRVQESKSIAWTKAKLKLANELNNGTSLSVAQDRANRTVDDYYSKIQKNNLEDWNAKMQQIRYLDQNTSLTVQVWDSNANEYANITDYRTSAPNYELVNGTTVNVTYVKYDFSGGTRQLKPADDTRWAVAQSPDTGDKMAIIGTGHEPILSTTHTQASDVKANMDAFATEVYDSYQAGDLNTTDIVDPSEIAYEGGTDYDSTGGYQYAAIQLAAVGHSGDFNSTFTVSTNKSTAEYVGHLFYTADDISQLEAGSTYYTDRLNGSFVMAVSNGDENNSAFVEEWPGGHGTTELKIVEMRDADSGEQINNTTVNQYVYEEANASKLQEHLDQLKRLREEFEEIQTAGGSTSSGSGISTEIIVGVGAVLALVAAARRDTDHSGGRK